MEPALLACNTADAGERHQARRDSRRRHASVVAPLSRSGARSIVAVVCSPETARGRMLVCLVATCPKCMGFLDDGHRCPRGLFSRLGEALTTVLVGGGLGTAL